MFVAGCRIGVALGLAGALMTAAACGGSADEPRQLPPLSSSPTTTGTASPAYDEKAALEAATAVVRKYFRLLNAPTTTANARELFELVGEDCACQRAAKSTLAIARKQQHYFGKTEVRSLTPSTLSKSQVEVLVEYDYTDGGIRDADGTVISRTSGGKGALLDFEVSFQNRRWLITETVVVRRARK